MFCCFCCSIYNHILFSYEKLATEMTFKPGDKVICISPTWQLKRGGVYNVIDTLDDIPDFQLIELKEVKDVLWSKDRFTLKKLDYPTSRDEPKVCEEHREQFYRKPPEWNRNTMFEEALRECRREQRPFVLIHNDTKLYGKNPTHVIIDEIEDN